MFYRQRATGSLQRQSAVRYCCYCFSAYPRQRQPTFRGVHECICSCCFDVFYRRRTHLEHVTGIANSRAAAGKSAAVQALAGRSSPAFQPLFFPTTLGSCPPVRTFCCSPAVVLPLFWLLTAGQQQESSKAAAREVGQSHVGQSGRQQADGQPPAGSVARSAFAGGHMLSTAAVCPTAAAAAITRRAGSSPGALPAATAAWADAASQPAPPPHWRAEPLPLLAHLPDDGSRTCPAVRQQQTACPLWWSASTWTRSASQLGSRGRFRKDLEGLLFRQGVQQPNSTTLWAATHRSDKGLACIEVSVQDTAAARQAARAAVELGYVAVAGFRVPVTYGRHTAPPAGCTVVTIHQLPVALGRQGCTEVLLKAAQQPGDVVCEFLGGSRTMGDAALSCPAATLWSHGCGHQRRTRYSPASLLDPSAWWACSERRGGRQAVAGTEAWPGLTAECIAARDAAMQAAARHGTQQQPPQPASPRLLEPPRQPGCRGTSPTWAAAKAAAAAAAKPAGGSGLRASSTQRQRQRVQRPGGQLPGGRRRSMREAETPSPGVQRPGGPLQPSPSHHRWRRRGATWLAGQIQLMVQDAARIADEDEGRSCRSQSKTSSASSCARFRGDIQQSSVHQRGRCATG